MKIQPKFYDLICLKLLNPDKKHYCFAIKMYRVGASLVEQWLRVCLPIEGTRVLALVWEDPTCRGATGPVSHNYWACASGASAPQQERPRKWEARAPRWGVAPACRNWREPSLRNEEPTQPKKKGREWGSLFYFQWKNLTPSRAITNHKFWGTGQANF